MIIESSVQTSIRESRAASMLITAPAGCGKTEALVLRAKGILERKELGQYQKILVLCFSNRAKENIQSRLRNSFPFSVYKSKFTVTNYHGLTARILIAHPQIAGISREFSLPINDWVRPLIYATTRDWALRKHIASALKDVKSQPLSDDEVMTILDQQRETAAFEIEKKRIEEKQLTYDDLLRLGEIALKNPGVQELYRAHFGAVLVDEVQDLTPQQLRITSLLGDRITYAGDLAQGIYTFAGASPNEVFAEIRKSVDAEFILDESYRSAPNILELINALRPLTAGVELNCADPSKWRNGGFVACSLSETVEAEASEVLSVIATLLAGNPCTRIAVVSRTDKRLDMIKNVFRREKIDFFDWKNPVFDKETATRLKRSLAEFSKQAFQVAKDRRAYLSELLGAESISDPQELAPVIESLDWLLAELNGKATVAEIEEKLVVSRDSDLINSAGVHVLNGHVGKGQQFDWVFILGLEEGTIPSFQASSEMEIIEEARVLSVMLSRARMGLFLSRVENLNGFKKEPSRFIGYWSEIEFKTKLELLKLIDPQANAAGMSVFDSSI